MSKLKSIAELLPVGLTEEAVTQVAELVDTVITEEVNERVKLLEAKVKAFLRMEIQSIKEHALKELQEENDIYRNAQLFEGIKSMMALELNHEDENRAISHAVKEHSQIEEENSILIEELNTAVNQIQELEIKIKALNKKNKLLEQHTEQLVDEVEQLTEQSTLPFKSSEKAMIIADEMETTPVKKVSKVNNQFLTESVMALMPKLNN